MSHRVEQIGPCTLHLADCATVLPTLTGVDAVVTDPPYGIGYSHGADSGVLASTTKFVGHKIIGDDKPFDPSPLLDFPEVILWGGNHFAERLPSRSRWLVWDKRDGVNSNDLADCEMAWTNSNKPARVFHHRWMGMLKDSERGVQRVHPTQKPIKVMAWCLSFIEGETVLDPYMGSGTTALACLKADKRFIGCEIDPTYFDIACERIRRAWREKRSELKFEEPINAR